MMAIAALPSDTNERGNVIDERAACEYNKGTDLSTRVRGKRRRNPLHSMVSPCPLLGHEH